MSLNKIQTELKAPKTQKNSFGGYNYRSCEDILEAVKPLLEKYEAVILLNDEIELIGERFYVKATARYKDKDTDISVSAYAREPLSKKGMDEAQITGATSSYARKYALNGLFAIDDTKDADATNTHEKQSDATISQEDIATLSSLFETLGGLGVDCYEGFLRSYKIKSLNELPKKLFKQAFNQLCKKIEQQKKGA